MLPPCDEAAAQVLHEPPELVLGEDLAEEAVKLLDDARKTDHRQNNSINAK